MQFRKKPVVIDAMQWTGGNADEISEFVEQEHQFINGELSISTLEGDHQATVGDWIIKGVQGEFYPCKPDIFNATYDQVPS